MRIELSSDDGVELDSFRFDGLTPKEAYSVMDQARRLVRDKQRS